MIILILLSRFILNFPFLVSLYFLFYKDFKKIIKKDHQIFHLAFKYIHVLKHCGLKNFDLYENLLEVHIKWRQHIAVFKLIASSIGSKEIQIDHL